MYNHFTSEQWQRPTEFLPERFDSESELFVRPGTNQPRHPKSFVPFTSGSRNCAGQTLAKLEGKILLARLLTKLDFDLSPQLLERKMVQFNFFGKDTLKVKILKKH